MVTTFHSREARSSTFCKSIIGNILCTGYLLRFYRKLSSLYYSTRVAVGEFHIARTDSTILDNQYRKLYTFEIGHFELRLTAWLEYESFLIIQSIKLHTKVCRFLYVLPLSMSLYIADPNLA